MSIFKQYDNHCYFIHIPRTGGRYLNKLFEKNLAYGPWCECYCSENEPIRGVQKSHLHYPLYNYFLDVENLIHFTIVRNPFDKIESSMNVMYNLHNENYNETLNTEEKFYDFLINEIEIKSFHNNWFFPQHKFISKKTNIWKYENGFGKEFYDWIYDKTKIVLNDKSIDSYEKISQLQSLNLDEKKCKTNFSLDKKFEKYIKNFYNEDYKLFEYH